MTGRIKNVKNGIINHVKDIINEWIQIVLVGIERLNGNINTKRSKINHEKIHFSK